MYTTIQTRLNLNCDEEILLYGMMKDWTHYYHSAWSLYNRQQQTEKQIYHNLMKDNTLTSNQVLSVINKVKTEHSKLKALTILQAKNQTIKIEHIQDFITKNEVKLTKFKNQINSFKSEKVIPYQTLNKTIIQEKKLYLILKGKKINLKRLNKKLALKQHRINTNNFKLCFGSTALFKKELSHHSNLHRKTAHQKVYSSNIEWKKDWDLLRVNQIYSVGDKKKPQSNAEIQYYPKTKQLRIRLSDGLALKRMKEYCTANTINLTDLTEQIKYSPIRMKCRFIVIENVIFNHNYHYLFQSALDNKQPVSAKIIRKLIPSGKEIGFYLQLGMEEINNVQEVKINKQLKKLVNKDDNKIIPRQSVLGIDLNANGLAYTIVKTDGNQLRSNINRGSNTNTLKAINGFIAWDLKGNTSNQNKNLISYTLEKIITIAQQHNIKEIAIENLDFNNTKNKMNSGYTMDKTVKVYNGIISQFITTQFKETLIRKCYRNNILVKLVNPSYSSSGGFTKYGIINKTQADVSASLWLARQGLLGLSYKVEENVVSIKKFNEKLSFPYQPISNQRNKNSDVRIKWKDVSLAIGKDRRFWVDKTYHFIQSLSRVAQIKLLDCESIFSDT